MPSARKVLQKKLSKLFPNLKEIKHTSMKSFRRYDTKRGFWRDGIRYQTKHYPLPKTQPHITQIYERHTYSSDSKVLDGILEISDDRMRCDEGESLIPKAYRVM